MKKILVCMLALCMIASLVGCGNQSTASSDSNVEPSQGAHLLSVNIKVIEAIEGTNKSFLAEALENCGDKISQGDTVSVTTDSAEIANVLQTYQENSNFKIYFPTVNKQSDGISVICFDVVQCESPNTIVDIVDRAKEEKIPYGAVMEKFFEDDTNEYYFSGLYSQYVIVHYKDGSQEDIVSALKAGRATIADLDKFGINYLIRENNNSGEISTETMPGSIPFGSDTTTETRSTYIYEELSEMPAEKLLDLFLQNGLVINDDLKEAYTEEELQALFKEHFDMWHNGLSPYSYTAYINLAEQTKEIYNKIAE